MDQCDFEKAFTVFSEGEKYGDPKCIYGKIAVTAKIGKDFSYLIPKFEIAIKTIHQEAESGDADAAFIIGRCYEIGLIFEQNLDLAIDYYNISARGGDTDAMFNTGCILMLQGDCDNAVAKYFIPAAKLGNESAINAVEHYKAHKKIL